MPEKKQPVEGQPDTSQTPRTSVNSELADLASTFASMLEVNFIGSLPQPKGEDSVEVFRKQVMTSFVTTMRETGASAADVAALMQDEVGRLLVPSDEPWNDIKNGRRVELIDLSIQQALSADEAFELAQLTEQMRQHVAPSGSHPTFRRAPAS